MIWIFSFTWAYQLNHMVLIGIALMVQEKSPDLKYAL